LANFWFAHSRGASALLENVVLVGDVQVHARRMPDGREIQAGSRGSSENRSLG
jgi:hypothetical protein